jgi:hypothetical protein
MQPLSRRRRSIPRTYLANAVVAIAAVALLALIASWVAGIGVSPAEVTIDGPGFGTLFLSSHNGRVVVGLDGNQPEYSFWWWRRGRPAGLSYLVNNEDQYVLATPWEWGFGAPHWFVALVLCIPIAWRWIGWSDQSEQVRRREHGLCRHCGYDLRASTDRCPECGEPTSRIAREFEAKPETKHEAA